jgi:hydroxymethylpyrimidine/phosphomethylpyrimidine kinase
VREQLESVFDDLSVEAVKIGMLHDEDIIDVVASALKKYKPPYVVLDPVMIAKSGHALLKSHTTSFLKRKLFPHVSLITPNIFEAEKLLGEKIETSDQQEKAAIELGRDFQFNVLIKGGHIQSEKSSDVLYLFHEDCVKWFHAPRIETINTHGTGCSLSSAIASMLSKNYSVIDAVSHAKNYLTKALEASSSLVFGLGVGPVDHFYYLREKNYVV